MEKILSIVLGSFIAMNVCAKNVIDVYGADDQQAKKIIHNYEKDFDRLHEELVKHYGILQDENNHSSAKKTLGLAKKNLMEKIKREQQLLYVNMNTVFYPGEENIYTTLEVIKPGDEKRLAYVDSNPGNKSAPKKNDLIQKMIDFEEISFRLIMNHEIQGNNPACPFYHCTLGFEHPELKPYEAVFRLGAKKESEFILQALKKDPDPERRAAAAFLAGCMEDPQKILRELMPAVEDKSAVVRNNAIRVIGSTILAAKIQDIDLKPFIQLLNSPQETDRNKSLLVLLRVSKNKKLQKIMIKEAGKQLIALLALKQPNNHEIAYSILKEISDNDFGEYNLSAWKQWMTIAQKSLLV